MRTDTTGPGLHYASVCGRDIRISIRRGSRTEALPLLLLMGLGGNIEMWEPFRSRFTERTGATSVAFDMPGTGGSPAISMPWPLAMLGRLTTEVARAAGLERYDLLGLSWGGLLAQQVALTVPRRVRRVVLANTNFGLGSVPGRLDALRVLVTPARYLSLGALERAYSTFGGGGSEGAAEHTAARLARPPTRRGYFNQILALTGWSSLPVLPLIRQPVLVVTGDDDQAVPLINARVMAALLAHGQLAVVKEGGHLLLFERTAEAVDLIGPFLTSPDVGPRTDR